MGRQEEEPTQLIEQKQNIPYSSSSSLSTKAVHFVSDIATGLLNPISDNKPSSTHPHRNSKNSLYSENISKKEETESSSEDDSEFIDGPDTSSFKAFLFSLLSSAEPGSHSSTVEEYGFQEESPVPNLGESGRKKSLISRGKHLGKAMYHAAKLGGFQSQLLIKSSSNILSEGHNAKVSSDEGIQIQYLNDRVDVDDLPETSDASLLLSKKTRFSLYASLPVPVKGRKWVLLYSTWRHGISLSTLYRRSMLWPGTSLLVVGDRKGSVFGGLVEAPLRPSTKKRYQGTNSSFVFSNVSGHPVVFHPTGANRYFTLCTTQYLALGGGGHFALYLDGDLLSGSSSASETYGNSCLACTEDFELKEVELWGFVYASKYEEVISLLRTEAPGICRLLNA